MPLQNRVDPFGHLHAVAVRGTLMGNRGVLHDDAGAIGASRWTTKAWIACRLEVPGRRRELMAAGSYTELFFLDEVTALAAGHRPCFECRRRDAQRFAHACGALTAPAIDDLLHRERFLVHEETAERDIYSALLPEGTAIRAGGEVFMRHARGWLRWSFEGYETATLPEGRHDLITPTLTVRALAHGYAPQWHPTSEAA